MSGSDSRAPDELAGGPAGEPADKPADELTANQRLNLPWPGIIGLCLSGGGYRATLFHLGVFSYLDRLGLLTQARMISAVSGATFTATSYAVSLVEERSFNDFFCDFYTTLSGTNLVELGFKELVTVDCNRPSGRTNVILAMADVYAKKFYADSDGEPYNLGHIINCESHLQELILNGLDYQRAEAFVFQRSASSDILVGNERLPVPRADAEKIRLADIVATCTSIPAAFEPLAFPDDFSWPDGHIPDATRRLFSDAQNQPSPVPLMDGGLHDNQGIDSLLFADERNPEDIDLFVLSDVFREPSAHYRMPEQRGSDGPTLGQVAIMAWILFFGGLITVGALVAKTIIQLRMGEFRPIFDGLLLIVPLVLGVAVLYLLYLLRRFVNDELLSRIPQVGAKSEQYIRQMPLQTVLEMAEIRVFTLIATSTTVIWKRVRNLGYRVVYGVGEYEGKRVSCLLQHLRPGQPFVQLPGVDPPSARMRQVAEVAGSMATILWFANDYQQPCVTATGQASICYNLMKHIARRYGQDPDQYPERVRDIWQRLTADWQLLRADPYALLRAHLPDGDFPEPPDDKLATH